MSQNRPRRQHVIKIRVDDVERSLLHAKAEAAGMTVAALLRNRIEQVQVVNRTDWQRRTYQLTKIGNNLHQILVWVNKHKSATDAQKVTVALLCLERTIRGEYGLQTTPEGTETSAP